MHYFWHWISKHYLSMGNAVPDSEPYKVEDGTTTSTFWQQQASESGVDMRVSNNQGP